MSATEAVSAGRCGDCGEPIEPGDQVVTVNDVDVHLECEGAALAAVIEMEGNSA